MSKIVLFLEVLYKQSYVKKLFQEIPQKLRAENSPKQTKFNKLQAQLCGCC